MMDSDRFKKPVEVGDEIEVNIESTGAKGDGIAKVNNFVIIVPGAKEGDRVKVKITRVLKKMAFAEVVGSGGSQEAAEEGTEEATEDESFSESEESSEENFEEEN